MRTALDAISAPFERQKPFGVQSSAKRLRPGLVNFVSVVAYHSCLSLPAAFAQPIRSLLADPCTRYAIVFD